VVIRDFLFIASGRQGAYSLPPVALWSKVYSENKAGKRLMRKISSGILAMTKVSAAPLEDFVQALASHDLE